jgi:hypothetical protein
MVTDFYLIPDSPPVLTQIQEYKENSYSREEVTMEKKKRRLTGLCVRLYQNVLLSVSIPQSRAQKHYVSILIQKVSSYLQAPFPLIEQKMGHLAEYQ